MNQIEKKNKVASAALDYIQNGQIIGIGSGTTVNCFIEQLYKVKSKIDAAVSASNSTTNLLKSKNIRVIELSESGRLPIYIDGADEATKFKHLIKGGGGALTREKIIAQASDNFICMIDDSKLVSTLGKFPLPIEVIKMSQSIVALEIIKLGGRPVLRENYSTDNGNIILDIYNLDISEPVKIESEINDIPGVVTNGLFAIRGADKILVSTKESLDII